MTTERIGVSAYRRIGVSAYRLGAGCLVICAGLARGQTWPDPGPQCFMLEMPPGWSTLDSQADWPYDKNFQPIIGVNASLVTNTHSPTVQGQTSAAAAIARRGQYRALVPSAKQADFDSRVAFFWSDIGAGGTTGYAAELMRQGLNIDVPNVTWATLGDRLPWRHPWMIEGAENLKAYTQGFLDAYDADLINNSSAQAPIRFFVNSEVRQYPVPSSNIPNYARLLIATFDDARASSAGSDLNNDGVGDNIVPMGSSNGKTLAQWRADADSAYSSVTFNIPFTLNSTTVRDFRWIGEWGPVHDRGWIRLGLYDPDNEIFGYGLGHELNVSASLWYDRLWLIARDGVLNHAMYKPMRDIRTRTQIPTNGKSWENVKFGNYLDAKVDVGSGLAPLASNATGRGRVFSFGWSFDNQWGPTDQMYAGNTLASRAQSATPTRTGPLGKYELRSQGNYPFYVPSGRFRVHQTAAASGDFNDVEFYGVLELQRQPNLYRPPVGSTTPYYESNSTGACPNAGTGCAAPQEHYIEAAVRMARYTAESTLNSVGNSPANVSYWVGMVGYNPGDTIPIITADQTRQLLSMLRGKHAQEIKFFGNNLGSSTGTLASRTDWDATTQAYYDVFTPQLMYAAVAAGESTPGEDLDMEQLRRTLHADNTDDNTMKLASLPVDDVEQTGLKLTFENMPAPNAYSVMRIVYEGWNTTPAGAKIDAIKARIYLRDANEEYKEFGVDDCATGGPCDGAFGYYSPDRSTRRTFDFRAEDGYDLHEFVDSSGSLTLKIINLGDDPFLSFYDHVQVYFFQADNIYDGLVAGGQSNAQSAGVTPPQGADFNHDGNVTAGDFIAFFDAYETQSVSADINADEEVDGADVTLFMSYYGG